MQVRPFGRIFLSLLCGDETARCEARDFGEDGGIRCETTLWQLRGILTDNRLRS